MASSGSEWQRACPQGLLDIATRLAATQSMNRQYAKLCEKELSQAETTEKEFGVKLLKIVAHGRIPETVQICSAIYFKNYVKKYWGLEENVISKSDRQAIQENLIQVMLGSTPHAQRQLSETISTIASFDFMQNWHFLKPTGDSGVIVNKWKLLQELVNFLKPPTAIDKMIVVLGIIQSITSEHAGKEKEETMVVQIRYIMKQFVMPLWLKFLKGWTNGAQTNFSNKIATRPRLENLNHAKQVILGLEQLVLIFHDLTSVDLIEYFEDKMSEWTGLFLVMLRFNDNFNILSQSEEVAGPIDRLRTAVIKSAELFASRYENEASDYLRPFVDTSIEILTTLDEKERYDMLVAETTNYLQTVVRQSWNQALFNPDNLNQIVSCILIRNIKLRGLDLQRYEMSGEEWVLRDMEGSDFCTRRRGALELLRKLCEVWPKVISNIVSRHVRSLLDEYFGDPQNLFVNFDTAVNLFLATNVMGETRADGATKLIHGQETLSSINDFLQKNAMPYLSGKAKAPHPLVSADCLKYAIIFRSQYPQNMFQELVPLACRFLANSDFVTHTYAAIALDRILAMKIRHGTRNDDDSKSNTNGKGRICYKYPKAMLSKNLGDIIVPLLKVLTTFDDSYENEYVMKTIMRVIIRAEEDITRLTEKILEQIVQIIQRVSRNPSKPTFNHYMFEIVAACIHYSCKNKADNVSHFKKHLMGTFQKILQNDGCNEFHPYVFQIISLMLRLDNKVDGQYVEIYDAMLKTGQWSSDGNIIAISSMFADYYRILAQNERALIEFMTPTRLTGTLGIYQHLLARRTQDIYAFRVLSALFEFCPLRLLDQHMKVVFELIFSRLKAQKTNTLCANFIKSLAVFVLRHGFKRLLNYCEQMQDGIFTMILTNVWLEYCRHVTMLRDRLIVTHAMISMVCHSDFLANRDFQKSCAKVICKIIEIFEVSPLEDKELNSVERRIQSLEDQGAGAKFSGLIFSKPPPNRGLTKNLGDPRQALVKSIARKCQEQAQFQQWLGNNLDERYRNRFNGYSKQFGIQVNGSQFKI